MSVSRRRSFEPLHEEMSCEDDADQGNYSVSYQSGRFTISPVIYSVTATCDGNGTAAASPASGASGTEVTLTASPAPGYHFKEWQVVSGGVTVANYKFAIGNANVEIKAIFEKDSTSDGGSSGGGETPSGGDTPSGGGTSTGGGTPSGGGSGGAGGTGGGTNEKNNTAANIEADGTVKAEVKAAAP